MAKIKRATIYKIYNGDGWPSLGLKLWLSGDKKVFASAVLADDDFSRKDLAEIFELALKKFEKTVKPFLAELDLDESASTSTDEWLEGWQTDSEALQPLSFIVSLAVNRAVAMTVGQELYQQINLAYGFREDLYDLPTPIFNMFNGGRHADTNLDFEEFLLIPLTKNQTSLAQKVDSATQVFHSLADKLKQAGFDTDLGSFGGYAPDMTSSLEAMDLIMSACQEAGFKWGDDFALGVDIGASYLSSGRGNYLFKLDHSRLQSANLVGLYEEWQARYELVYLEDPLAGSDISGWRRLTNGDNQKLILAGDEFFNNDQNKFRQNLKSRLANTIVIKPSKLATLSEACQLIKLAQEHNYQVVLSQGDQETNDSFLADLAVASNVEYFKAGSLARGERLAKLNRLIEIEQDLVN